MAKPRHPASSPFFSLAADPVQQGLFATSSYEAKTKTKLPKPIVVDKRQVDMFGSPIGPLDDDGAVRNNPRPPKETRSMQQVFDDAMQRFYRAGEASDYLDDDDLYKQFHDTFVSLDKWFDKARPTKRSVVQAAQFGVEGLEETLESIGLQPGPDGRWGRPEDFAQDQDDEPRENDGSQKFFRRTPVQKRRGETKRQHKWRYVYDVDAALRGKARALIGEKIRLPYKGVFGHYEVLRRLPLGNLDNTVAVLHDETGHLMAINEACLRQLARDVYRPAEGTTSAEDVRHRHEREDALPRSRAQAYRAILDASGIEDHDFSRADAAYAAWKAKKPKPKKPPPPWKGGQLDVFEGDLKNKKHFTSLLEAFEHATRGAKTWRDLSPVLVQLESALGVPVRFPDDVLDRQGEHERDLRDFSEGIDVEQYGVTLEQSGDIEGDIFMAATMDPPVS